MRRRAHRDVRRAARQYGLVPLAASLSARASSTRSARLSTWLGLGLGSGLGLGLGLGLGFGFGFGFGLGIGLG